jgi:transcription initiation factor TFIIH subunit 4
MFGLVYQRKRSSKRYYPTKLAINLVSGASLSHTVSSSPHKAAGFIVIETNFRVIAYTDSQLQIAILALFCQLQYRFPNMAVGTITRESIHQALINGITADQILSFLRLHAHQQMMANNPIIPPTVTDQLRLWEIERNRLQFEDGVLYSEFMSASDFDKVRRYAEDLGVLTWSNPGKRLMVVSQNGHDEVRRFWRRQKNS